MLKPGKFVLILLSLILALLLLPGCEETTCTNTIYQIHPKQPNHGNRAHSNASIPNRESCNPSGEFTYGDYHLAATTIRPQQWQRSRQLIKETTGAIF